MVVPLNSFLHSVKSVVMQNNICSKHFICLPDKLGYARRCKHLSECIIYSIIQWQRFTVIVNDMTVYKRIPRLVVIPVSPPLNNAATVFLPLQMYTYMPLPARDGILQKPVGNCSPGKPPAYLPDISTGHSPFRNEPSTERVVIRNGEHLCLLRNNLLYRFLIAHCRCSELGVAGVVCPPEGLQDSPRY